ncbi:Macrolide export protein MacA [Sporomusa carbonis]|uniref:efflux RND transporter periplasmic adaptor subunit n=1 Tax=Sporomusa carbonis TaxID=3076075 RepID=UPI003A651167
MQAIVRKLLQHKKWLLLIMIAAIAVPVGYYIQSNKAKAAVSVQTAKVERGDMVSVVSATGTIKPVNMVDISSKITGLLKEVRVKENDQVKAGQVLVVLDDTQLQAQVSQARERLANAEANYQRNQRLSSIGAVSEQQLDSSRLDYKVAQASYDQVVSQLEDTVIKSPIDGVVIGKPIPAGQTVAQGISNPMVILSVADMSKLQIETQVDESDIGKVAVGQKATFTVDAFPGKTFNGTVAVISQKATVQSNVVYYTVVINVDSDNDGLKPTMTARVSIQTGESKNALTVPLAAIKNNKDQQYVVVMKNGGQMENVPVTTGLTSDDRIEITSGLSDGDVIVLSQAKTQTSQKSSQNGSRGMGIGGMMPR